MMKTVTSILFILFVAMTFTMETNAGNQCRSETGGYCLKLPEITAAVVQTPNTGFAQVPGLEFLNLPADAKIGDVLAQLYVFGISIVGVSALLVLVSAGVWYMTAGDNQTRTGQAKTWMGNAIFGLILALVSYLILYTINPSLVNTLNVTLEKLNSANQPGGDQTAGNQPTGLCFSLDNNYCSTVTCTFSPDTCAGNTKCVTKDSCPK